MDMKVLFAASECVPFVKTGGLADVAGALPPVLKARGVDVRVILPLYSAIADVWKAQMKAECEFEVELGWRRQYCGIKSLVYQGVTFYFVDNQYYFGRDYIYGLGGDEYERYGFFDRAVIDAMRHLDFQPDIVHCHDWQSGMIPALLKIQYQHVPFYSGMRTAFTIHNLQYQGVFGIKDVQDTLGLGDSLFTADKLECYGCANFLKAGLVYADEITTVSRSYADEIQTAYYGERLEGLLRARREQLWGIVNGIDVNDYNPGTDPRIYRTYSTQTLLDKAANKEGLQRELGLNVDPDAPVVGIISRLSHQKGLDLIEAVIRELMDAGIQLVVLGMGDAKYTDLFSWAEGAYPGRVAARFAMDHQLAHRIYAGADMFLMPSLFEPCGLSQLIALRYGTVPIVRETGGLRDTVLSYNEYTGEGNGFTFFNYNAHDMLFTVRRAVNYYKNHKDVWHTLQVRGMEGDYSWNHSAGEYIQMYEKLLTPVSAMRMPDAPSAPDTEEAEPAEEPEPAVQPEKPRRAPRKKAERAEGEAPKTRRAPRRKAADTAAENAEEKPKARRAPRKTAATEKAAEEAPEKPRRAPRKKAAPRAEEAPAEPNRE
jgi:starch synthase